MSTNVTILPCGARVELRPRDVQRCERYRRCPAHDPNACALYVQGDPAEALAVEQDDRPAGSRDEITGRIANQAIHDSHRSRSDVRIGEYDAKRGFKTRRKREEVSR